MINWFSLTLCFVFCLTFFYLFTKKLLNEKNDPRLYGGMMQFLGGLLGLAVIIFTGFSFRFTHYNIFVLILEGIVYTIASSLYYVGLQNTDLSKSIVLEASTAIWSIVAGALILGEIVTAKTILAAGMIFIAIIIVSDAHKTLLKLNRNELMILFSSVFYAIGACLDNYLVGFSNPSTYLSLSMLLPGLMILAVNYKRLRPVGLPMLKNKKFVNLLFLSSFSLVVAYTALLYAYKMGGQVSKMMSITQTQTIIIAFLGITFFKETKHLPQKIAAVILTFIGLILLKG